MCFQILPFTLGTLPYELVQLLLLHPRRRRTFLSGRPRLVVQIHQLFVIRYHVEVGVEGGGELRRNRDCQRAELLYKVLPRVKSRVKRREAQR